MEQLKKDITKAFILFAFLLAVIESMVSSVFDDYLFVLVNQDKVMTAILIILYLSVSLGLFIVFAWLFTRNISSKINSEMHRQVDERNILYANIAHDLKTPITSILGFSQVLREKELEVGKKEQLIETIYKKSKHTANLIDAIFHYSKLEADGYQMILENLDICRLTRDIVASLYELIEENEIKLIVDIPNRAMMYCLDKLEYTRAFTNLLVNACIHNVKGGTILVKVFEEIGRKSLQIIVADDGENIPENIKATLFEPFVNGDESRSSKSGSGLGLAIARSIVEKNNGSLKLYEPYETYTKAFIMEFNIKN